MKRPITGIVVAGGKSTRMGSDKASLPWDTTDILHTELTKLASICDDLIVVSNIPRNIQFPGVRVVPDNHRDCGPLGGMEAGLTAARHELCFIIACDMPFLDIASAAYIVEAAADADAAVPRIDGCWHPLYAAYRRTCLPIVRNLLLSRRLRLSELLESISAREITKAELIPFSVDLAMLNNLNTPQEWQNYVGKSSI